MSDLKLFLATDGRLRPGWRFAIALLIFIVTDATAVVITSSFVHYGPNPLLFEMIFRPFHLILLLTAFALMLRFLDRSAEEALVAQGLGIKTGWHRDLALGMVLGGGLVSFAIALIAWKGAYRVGFISGARPSAVVLVIWVLLTSAMLEEVMFRGYPFQRLVESMGPVAATLVLSLCFGAIHLGNPHATKTSSLNTVLVGMLFSIAYLKTKRLWLPFGLHFAWNATMGLLFGLPVSGLSMFSVVLRGTAQGPRWLTGGDYGIEASLTGTTVIICGIIVLAVLPLKHSSQENEPVPALARE